MLSFEVASTYDEVVVSLVEGLSIRHCYHFDKGHETGSVEE